MVELELFYEKVESAIREEQAAYLRKQRAQPFKQDLPVVQEVSAEAYAKMTILQKIAYRWELRKQVKRYNKALKRQNQPVDERLTRGYNAGIELSLTVLEREFVRYYRRLEKQEQ